MIENERASGSFMDPKLQAMMDQYGLSIEELTPDDLVKIRSGIQPDIVFQAARQKKGGEQIDEADTAAKLQKNLPFKMPSSSFLDGLRKKVLKKVDDELGND